MLSLLFFTNISSQETLHNSCGPHWKYIYNQESGVRQRILPLVEENGSGLCPKEKVMSRKCKGEKNKNKKDKKKESKKEKHGDKQGDY